MTCFHNHPTYVPVSEGGLLHAIANIDGYSIKLNWNRGYPDLLDYRVVYNIYYSTLQDDVFDEGVKFVAINGELETEIAELSPGETYFFAVRASEFDPDWINFPTLPDAGSSKYYPEASLTTDLTDEDLIIPISDIETFPNYGIVLLGGELIRYTNKDLGAGNLLGTTRGFLGTEIRPHQTDGYDGYQFYPNPLVQFWKGFEEPNEVIFMETAAFAYPHFARTDLDGYQTVLVDLLTTELGGTDESFGSINVQDGGTSEGSQEAFPAYDYSGWHRTDLNALLRGDCLDSYFGGEQFCADGYSGVGRQLRGNPISEEAARREEILLEATGEAVVLVRRRWTGIRCSCFVATHEAPDDRCPKCLGGGIIVSYQQFINPRRSDGRILVRFGPAEDDLKQENAGLESTFNTEGWTLVVPAVKDRDFLVRYNEDGTREFRYEVLSTTRNKLFLGTSGAQKMRLQRVRKTDPLYQVRIVDSTAPIPTVLTTTIGMVSGPGGIAPHVHNIVVPPSTVSLAQINGTTSVAAGHNHLVINGTISSNSETENLGHSHTFIL